MKSTTMRLIFLTTLTSIMMMSLPALAAKQITMGTGGQTGVYFAAGQSVCGLLNQGNLDLNCKAPSTGGSIANINGIKNGEYDLAMAQADWVYHAYRGTDKFSDAGADKDVRVLFSLHEELFSVMARSDAKIMKFEDLRGKVVDRGNPGSGTNATAGKLFAASGYKDSDFKLLVESKAAEYARNLCDGKTQAYFYVVGHPTANLMEASSTCDTNLVSVSGKAVDKLIAEYPYFIKGEIPGGLYKGSDKSTPTFGMNAVVTTSAKMSEEEAYKITKTIFENLDKFKKTHPAFSNLDAKRMATNGITAPLHDGAAKYFKEAGLM